MNPVKDAGALLRERPLEARDSMEDAMRSTRERLQANILEHPMRAIAVSVGAGLLLGLLLGLGRRRSND